VRRQNAPDILEGYAEDAAFLWSQRDAATDQPHYALPHLATLEQRIEARIDALRVAEEAGIAAARTRLAQSPGAGEVFVAAVLALESGRDAVLEAVLELAESTPGSERGLLGAFGWVPPEALRGRAVSWLHGPRPFSRLVGVAACSVHRADPGARLETLLHEEPSVRARALRLVGELGRVDVRASLQAALAPDDAACRFWAAWSLAVIGDRDVAIDVLRSHVTDESAFRWRALDVLPRFMDREAALAWLRDLGKDDGNARLLITSVGAFGDPAAVPWLIQKMSVPTLARVAGESFSTITGVDLPDADLDGRPPDGLAGSPPDTPVDDTLATDPDDNLPWPDAHKVQEWWQLEERRFPGGVRHLRGHPLTRESCYDTLQNGYQRHRRAAAHELALMSPGRHLWNWRARARVQRRLARVPDDARTRSSRDTG
jgi:uncharacterized protein (TIGR02270 family)